MSNREYHKKYKRDYLKLNKALSVTIPIENYQELESRAKAWKMKPTTLFRELALSQLDEIGLVPEFIETELKELRFLILNIANNVNQMAHHSNTIRSLVDEKGLLRELRRLEESINDYTHDRLKKVTHDH